MTTRAVHTGPPAANSPHHHVGVMTPVRVLEADLPGSTVSKSRDSGVLRTLLASLGLRMTLRTFRGRDRCHSGLATRDIRWSAGALCASCSKTAGSAGSGLDQRKPEREAESEVVLQ